MKNKCNKETIKLVMEPHRLYDNIINNLLMHDRTDPNVYYVAMGILNLQTSYTIETVTTTYMVIDLYFIYIYI